MKNITKILSTMLGIAGILACVATAQEPTPIEDAITKKDTARVEQMLKSDPALTKKPLDDIGNTALICAADSPEITKLLIKAGADVNAKSETGISALYSSVGNGNLAVINALVEAGADPKVVTKSGETLLMQVSRVKTVDDVAKIADKLLAKVPALLNQQDGAGFTAVMHAVDKGNLPLVKYLLAKGASVLVKNQDGQTALVFAKSRLEWLKSQGSSATPADTEVMTLLEKATRDQK